MKNPLMYNNREIVITKNLLYQLLGGVLLAVALILMELFNFVEAEFDFSLLAKPSFWSSYFFKLLLSYLAYFGIYIIMKEHYLRSPKIVIQRERLRDEKAAIVQGRQIDSFEKWLNNLYNFQIAITRWRLNAEKRYMKAKTDEERKPIKEELLRIDKFNELLKARKDKNTALEEELLQGLQTDEINRFMPNLSYTKLFNVNYSNCANEDSVEYEEGRTILGRIAPTIAFGVFLTAMLSSLLPPLFLEVTAEVIIQAIGSLLLLCWYVFNGLRMAYTIVFGRVYGADSVRLDICERYKEFNS